MKRKNRTEFAALLKEKLFQQRAKKMFLNMKSVIDHYEKLFTI